MLMMTVAEARRSLPRMVDAVSQAHAGYLIRGRRNQAVLISMEDWNAIQETLYLNSIPGMVSSIREGMETPVEDCATELPW